MRASQLDVQERNLFLFNKAVREFAHGRQLHIRPGQRWDYNGKNYLHVRLGVDKWPEEVQRGQRQMLVIGTGRCGTTSFAHCCRDLGLDVQHERVGSMGSVSHFFCADSEWYPYRNESFGRAHVGERRDDYRFEHILHLVRHPLDCIPSIASNITLIDYEFCEDCGLMPLIEEGKRKSKLYRAMWMYHFVNAACRRQTDILFRVEDLYRGGFEAMLESAGLPPLHPVEHLVSNQSRGFMKANRTTWASLRMESPTMYDMIRDMCRDFGYKENAP